MATESILTKSQSKQFTRIFDKPGTQTPCKLVVTIRYDDEYGNGHNTFAITGVLYENFREVACGCLHKDIAQHFPEFTHLIKWHGCTSNDPLYYIENTLYFASEHGPTKAWVYYTPTQPIDPLGLIPKKEILVGYEDQESAKQAEKHGGYRVRWDEKTRKERDLEAARRSAIWLDATDNDLIQPGLEQRLKDRLPALLEEFRQVIESIGFVY